jgi:ferritin-like metal-binding protein YciE
MSSPSPLLGLLHDRLVELHALERSSIDALTDAANAVLGRGLRQVVLQHIEDTSDHLARLEEVFSLLKLRKGEATSPSHTLVEDVHAIVQRHKGSSVLDAAVICAVQAMEHHEIAVYGTLREWADNLNELDAFEISQSILEEEAAFDEELSELAESANGRAAGSS